MQLVKQKGYMELAQTNEQKSLISAIFSNNKISTYQNKDMGEIIDLIARWKYMVGVQAEISAMELVAISEYIKSNYGELTIPEIDLAINLSLKNVFPVDNRPFGAFSPLYISTILNAYNEYKSKILKEINEISVREQNKLLLEQQIQPPPLSEQVQDIRIIIKKAFVTYKNDNIFTDPFSLIYKILKKKGAFNKLTKETIEKLKDDALKFSKNPKNTPSGPFLSVLDKPKKPEELYERRLKHILCEHFFDTYTHPEDFEQFFLNSINENDLL